MRMGRTIAERREQLETSSERLKAREKTKRKKTMRLSLTIVWFFVFLAFILYVLLNLIKIEGNDDNSNIEVVTVPYPITVDVIDEDGFFIDGKITSRMKEYIGQAENDFRDLGYTPTKVVIPTGSIREVDFYLEGYTGYVKLTIDRGSAVSVEDADRMIRYLASVGVYYFEYVDVRVEERGYWK